MLQYAASIFPQSIQMCGAERRIKLVTVEQYQEVTSEHLTEVSDNDDECEDFCVEDFFNHLGASRDSTILVYAHTLDSTQTVLLDHCKGYQNIVCTTDIQTNGKGVTCEEE